MEDRDDNDAVNEEHIEIIDAEKGTTQRPEKIGSFKEPLHSTSIHRAKTASVLAIWSLIGLCFVFLANYGTVAWLVWHNRVDAIEPLNRVFSTWVPIFAGLVGSAATFYFTQERH